uniref:ATP synthase F0 subunit 8 n=1 Tax=Globodera rostochiensis TaxID=31243 RepID=A0A914H0Y0_GLORO
MPKQSFDLIDYFGPLAVWIVFFSIIFVVSVTCILWCCVSETDDATVFANWGIGPRSKRKRALLQRQNWHQQLKQRHKTLKMV